jgi:hypothetical protein
MIKEIAELINNNYNQIRNNNNCYFIKIELGKYHSHELFEKTTHIDGFIEHLNQNHKILINREYYQYQHQNHKYQRERTFKSLSFTDDLIETVAFRDKAKEHGNDYRISLHFVNPENIFSQQMNYHNIWFVIEKSWQLNDNCQVVILTQNKKKFNHTEISYDIYFKVKIPLSEISLNQINRDIINIEKFFKHKYDKKRMFRSLDLVVEYEQPLQDEDLDNEPSHHLEE